MKQAESYGRKKREALPYFGDFGSEYNLMEPNGRTLEQVKHFNIIPDLLTSPQLHCKFEKTVCAPEHNWCVWHKQH